MMYSCAPSSTGSVSTVRTKRKGSLRVDIHCHYLNAAQGWIELNDSDAAERELQKINPDARLHPLFLLVRWELYANGKQWQAGHTIADYLVQNFPEEPIGWLQRSYALHAMGRTVEAFQQLLASGPVRPSREQLQKLIHREKKKETLHENDNKKFGSQSASDPVAARLLCAFARSASALTPTDPGRRLSRQQHG